MKQKLQVLRKGNHRNRLTVTEDRITLKLQDDVTEEQEKHLIKFALMVAQRVWPIFCRAMRGCFSSDLDSIEMQNTNRSIYSLYCIDELEPEGICTGVIKSKNSPSLKDIIFSQLPSKLKGSNLKRIPFKPKEEMFID
jgi:hypothetical protein